MRWPARVRYTSRPLLRVGRVYFPPLALLDAVIAERYIDHRIEAGFECAPAIKKPGSRPDLILV
jgi:hypothetical protein